MGMDSHDDLLRLHGIPDKQEPPDFARVEIAPDNANYLKPDKWAFRLDEQIKPTWWNPAYEAYTQEAWTEWKKEVDKILIYKPIIHPFRDRKPPRRITKKHIDLLKQWASVRDSVEIAVRSSAQSSVGCSIWFSIWSSVQVLIWSSVGDLTGPSSLSLAPFSVWAYAGSFFNLPRDTWKYTDKIKCEGYPFQPAVDLWEMGLVPSYDGEIWRLHGGLEGKAIWEGEIETGD
jgi:hypothetical protein